MIIAMETHLYTSSIILFGHPPYTDQLSPVKKRGESTDLKTVLTDKLLKTYTLFLYSIAQILQPKTLKLEGGKHILLFLKTVIQVTV